MPWALLATLLGLGHCVPLNQRAPPSLPSSEVCLASPVRPYLITHKPPLLSRPPTLFFFLFDFVETPSLVAQAGLDLPWTGTAGIRQGGLPSWSVILLFQVAWKHPP